MKSKDIAESIALTHKRHLKYQRFVLYMRVLRRSRNGPVRSRLRGDVIVNSVENLLNMVATEAAEARAEYEIRKRNAEERDMSDSEFFDHLLAIYRNRAEASVLCLLTYKSHHTRENWNQLMEARKREFVAMRNLKTFSIEERQP